MLHIINERLFMIFSCVKIDFFQIGSSDFPI